MDLFSVLNYYIKKGDPRAPIREEAGGSRVPHANSLKKKCKERHFLGIHDRFIRDENLKNMVELGRSEELRYCVCMVKPSTTPMTTWQPRSRQTSTQSTWNSSLDWHEHVFRPLRLLRHKHIHELHTTSRGSKVWCMLSHPWMKCAVLPRLWSPLSFTSISSLSSCTSSCTSFPTLRAVAISRTSLERKWTLLTTPTSSHIPEQFRGIKNRSRIISGSKRTIIPKMKNEEAETIKSQEMSMSSVNSTASFCTEPIGEEVQDPHKSVTTKTMRKNDIPELTKDEVQAAIDILKKRWSKWRWKPCRKQQAMRRHDEGHDKTDFQRRDESTKCKHYTSNIGKSYVKWLRWKPWLRWKLWEQVCDELQHHHKQLERRVQQATHQARHQWRRRHNAPALQRTRGAHALRLQRASLFHSLMMTPHTSWLKSWALSYLHPWPSPWCVLFDSLLPFYFFLPVCLRLPLPPRAVPRAPLHGRLCTPAPFPGQREWGHPEILHLSHRFWAQAPCLRRALRLFSPLLLHDPFHGPGRGRRDTRRDAHRGTPRTSRLLFSRRQVSQSVSRRCL